MIDNIKNIVNLMAEMQNMEEFKQDYESCRHRLQEAVEIRLQACSAADSKLNNDMYDLVNMAKEEGVMLGLYYGIKLLKSIDRL